MQEPRGEQRYPRLKEAIFMPGEQALGPCQFPMG